MLYAQILISAITIASGYLEYQLLSDFQNGIYASQELAEIDADANDARQELVAALSLAIFVISGFLILRWIHRACYNARQLGASGMEFTPGWSIAYYFIPIVALWKPYQAMKEIWKASKDPSEWVSQKTSALLPIWWTIWLVSGVAAKAVIPISSRVEELSQMMTLNLVMQASYAMDILLALVFLAIVNNVYKMQSARLGGAENMLDTTPLIGATQ